MVWLLCAGLGSPAWAEVDRAYERAVTLVDRMYLYPDDVDASGLLRAAARSLADEVDWLLIEADGDVVHLRHGDGTALGSVSVHGIETLPTALARLEELVRDYPGASTDADLRLALLSGLADGLDRYSRVLAGDSLDRFDVRLKGTLVGIGATITYDAERMVVRKLTDGAPAQRGGVVEGDELLRIDGVSTLNMPVKEAVRRIRGDVDTPIVLTVKRGERVLDLTLRRAEVVVPNVTHEALPGGIGYLQIDHFSQRTVQNLQQALAALDAEGSGGRGLIIDLRGNTGGSMREAARSADLFLHGGLLLTTEGRDGGRVQNLQGRIDAVDDGTERDVGIVVLMDPNTASGAEILAGALLAHERAVLVGTRSYGKGTVQKIYNLDEAMRLKLTVAQYLLEGGRKIAEGGLVADITFGEVLLNRNGARFYGFEERRTGVAFDRVVPVLDERSDFRGVRRNPGDATKELARRALVEATSPERAAVLAAARRAAAELRTDEEQHLVDALAAKGIDWSAGSPPARGVRAHVEAWSTPDPTDPDAVIVHATVRNDGDEPLPRAIVELTSDTFGPWNGLYVPVGRVAGRATGEGTVRVELNAGVEPREDEAEVLLRVADQPAVPAGETVLLARSGSPPRVAVSAMLAGRGDDATVSIEVVNRGEQELSNLEVYFEAPGDLDVELIDRASRIRVLDAGSRTTFPLRVTLGEGLPDVVPLRLVIEADGERLAQWVVELPRDGRRVHLEAPRVSLSLEAPLSLPAGPWRAPVLVEDDAALDHVVLYVNGEKVAWVGGGSGPLVEVETLVDIGVGSNRIVALAVDDQGLVTREQWTVRGELPAAVDADGVP